MGKPIQKTYLQEKSSYDVFPFGEFKGKTIGWMADNHPTALEAWQRSRKIKFSRDIVNRITKAKFLGS